MSIGESLRREIGREAIRFCRECSAIEERARGAQVSYICHNTQCRLWAFLAVLGLRPGSSFDGPAADEAMRETHAREVRKFRGLLPFFASRHDWDADARFHDLFPGAPAENPPRTFDPEDTRWRS